jgi:hypothetical protein
MELDESSPAGDPIIFGSSGRSALTVRLAGSGSIPAQSGRTARSDRVAMIIEFVNNYLVTWVWENPLRVQGSAVCSKLLDLLKIRSPGAGLAANLGLCSADDAALATELTTREGMVAVLSTLDMVASSLLPRRLAEASEAVNALLHDSAFPVSANHWNSQTPRSCLRQDAQSEAKGGRLRDDATRQQFQVALLENCSFFADVVLRQVRAGSDSSGGLLERDLSRKKLNAVRVSPTASRSKANVVPQQRSEEPSLPPETLSSLLPSLWVELGCRHLQTLVSEKERHEYGEDSKPAL